MEIIVTGYRHDIIRRDYHELRGILGGSGASSRVAEDMVRNLEGTAGKMMIQGIHNHIVLLLHAPDCQE
ncbi:MAG: hypothetical protein MZV63_62595 [Marinilabiliales bacterium]|nr:hypothetical protein [Marinilabiliales bacterium]